jgi:hypothetical protein
MKRQVYLANCGNVDFRQDDTKPLPFSEGNKLVEVESKEEARDHVINYINHNDLGGGNWIGGHYFEDGKMVGYFSYNARYWDENDANFKHYKRDIKDLHKI